MLIVFSQNLEKIFQQDEDAAKGFEDISYLLVRHQQMEAMFLSEGARFVPRWLITESCSDTHQSCFSPAENRQLTMSIEAKVVSLYTKVYVYQIRIVLQYSRSKPHRFVRNAIGADDWKKMVGDIEPLSQQIDKGVQDLTNGKVFETWQTANDILRSTANIETLQEATLSAVHLQSLPPANNAIFDSSEVQKSTFQCLSGTQLATLGAVQAWAEDPSAEPIFWLHGLAGTGKSSIALTVAHALDEGRPFAADGNRLATGTYLGATFFFSQGDATRNTTEKLFPTLARSLAQRFPDVARAVVRAIEESPDIATKAPQQQLEKLIVGPLASLGQETFVQVRLVVVIDALDECKGRDEAEMMVQLLGQLERLSGVQIRVFITSRNESHISRGFDALLPGSCKVLTLEKVGRQEITSFLTDRLAKVARRRDFPETWPGVDIIAKLTDKTEGLFIYAATLCRFLDDDFFDDDSRDDRLKAIFDDEADTGTPLHEIDQLYLRVLAFVSAGKRDKEKSRIHELFREVLGVIVVVFAPLSIESLGHFLPWRKAALPRVLASLHSVLDVPLDGSSLGLVHLSFRDFLLSKARCQPEFWVDEISVHGSLFDRCLDIMRQGLQQDMCNLQLPGSLASEVPQSIVRKHLPPHLQYSCRYWVDHVAKLDGQRREARLRDNGDVHNLLREKFLFWLEAMSLMGETATAILIINHLQTLINVGNPTLVFLISQSGAKLIMK